MPEAGMVYGDANLIDEDGQVIGRFPARQTDYPAAPPRVRAYSAAGGFLPRQPVARGGSPGPHFLLRNGLRPVGQAGSLEQAALRAEPVGKLPPPPRGKVSSAG